MNILIAGDFSPTSRVAELDYADTPVCSSVFGGVADIIESADLSIVHLECPLTTQQAAITKSGPLLVGKPEAVKLIKAGGFDVVTLAGNHILDMGPMGLQDTVRVCHEHNLKTVGVGDGLDAAGQPLRVDLKEGRTLALLNYTEVEFSIAGERCPGANPWDPIKAFYDIQQMKADGVELIVVIVHGGTEYYPYPSPERVKQFRFIADAGASAIVSHHSHCSTGYETYQGVPIFYGLGNFLFDRVGKPKPGWHDGYMVKLLVDESGIHDFEVIPYTQCRSECKVELMSDSDRDAFLERVSGYNQVIGDDAALRREWDVFCRAHAVDYLLQFYRYPKLLASVIRRCPLLGKLFMRFKTSDGMLNFMQCLSLREALVNMLRCDRDSERG